MNYSSSNFKKYHVAQLGEYACGLACLSSISRYYGGDISQEKLREMSGTTLNGTSMLGLYQAAKNIGFEVKGFEADLDNLKSIDHPVILHIITDQKREHFIVCYGYNDDHFWIGDPAKGIIAYSEGELGLIWQSKTLLSLRPTDKFQTQTNQSNNQLSWLFSLIQEDVPILTIAAVIGILMAVLGLSTAIFSQKLIDDFLPNQANDKIIIGFIALFILLVARSVLGLLRGIFMARQGKDLNVRLIHAFITKIIRLPTVYFKGYSTGDLIARMNDSLRIRNTVALVTGNVLISLLIAIISSVYILTLSISIGLASISSLLFFTLIAWRFQPSILHKQKEVMTAHSANESQYIDTLTGIKTIKSYSRENIYNARINSVYDAYQTRGYELMIIGNRFDFLTQLVTGVYITGIFALGVWQVVNQQLQLGELMGIITVVGSMIPSIAGLMIASIQIQEAKVAFNRMHELASLDSETPSDEHIVSDNSLSNNLTINHLTFRHPGSRPLFQDVSLSILRGKIITLFGDVGSGKSTLVDILQSFYQCEAGTIDIGGKNLNDFNLSQWRSMIGVVAQKEKVFNSTVIDNICMSNDLNEIQECTAFLEKNHLLSYFDRLPQGVLTLCGEDGNNLSGGQKQLVGIVRALYKQPDFLILDESTSAMDQATEHRIVDQLRLIAQEKNMGILLITHRLSLAMQSERIYLLENGSIQNAGTHEDLTKDNNSYSQSYHALIRKEQQIILH